MTRPAPDLAKIRADRLAKAVALVERDLILRLRLAIADPEQGRVEGLTVAEAMGQGT